MMQISITDIIAGLTVLELFIFFLFFSINNKKRINQLLLSMFLLAYALYLVGYLLFSFFNDILPGGVHLFFIGTSFGFLLGPLLLLYTKSLVTDHFRIKPIDFLHLIPFIIYNLIYGLYFYFESADTKIEMLSKGSVLPFSLGFKINFLMNLQILIYIGVSILLLYNYDKRLKSLYSAIHHLSLDWLRMAVFIFMLAWIIDFVHFLTRNTTVISSEISGALTLITLTINLVFINFIIYKELKQPSHFFKAVKELPKLKNIIPSDNEMKIHMEKLQRYMINDKPYLTANLTLMELAQRLEINFLILLFLIKKEKQKTFFDYINSYRIEDAKMILSDPSKRKMTMIEVLYGVGFDSKAVFKKIFKKFTGVYPREYRKRYAPHHSHHAANMKLPN